jgi:hypothetical protein
MVYNLLIYKYERNKFQQPFTPGADDRVNPVPGNSIHQPIVYFSPRHPGWSNLIYPHKKIISAINAAKKMEQICNRVPLHFLLAHHYFHPGLFFRNND